MRATLEEAENEARKLGRLIKADMPEGWGFVLMLVSHGENGVFTYLSDCQRQDIIKFLREIAYKLEANEKEI